MATRTVPHDILLDAWAEAKRDAHAQTSRMAEHSVQWWSKQGRRAYQRAMRAESFIRALDRAGYVVVERRP